VLRRVFVITVARVFVIWGWVVGRSVGVCRVGNRRRGRFGIDKCKSVAIHVACISWIVCICVFVITVFVIFVSRGSGSGSGSVFAVIGVVWLVRRIGFVFYGFRSICKVEKVRKLGAGRGRGGRMARGCGRVVYFIV
jgi:hypothetical protein